jgi:aspartyl-tRNA(Asn)/glutamyl-tRNA(Gln) amidotransferase subunit C
VRKFGKIGRFARPVRGGTIAKERALVRPADLGLAESYETSMTISLSDVQRIAHLARLEIDATEAEEVRAKLDAIFGMIDQLAAIDTTGVVPMAHAQDVTLPLRADEVTEVDLRVTYQSVAPAVEDGLYLVPKVIE